MARKAAAAVQLAALPGTAGKTRQRKLVCSDSCGYPPLRCSRAAIERGLPVCPCGAVLWPDALEDAELAAAAGTLDATLYELHPRVAEYRRQLDRVARGQQGHARKGIERLDSIEGIAALRVAQSTREDATAARLNAARAGGTVTYARRTASDASTVVEKVAALTRDTDPIPF